MAEPEAADEEPQKKKSMKPVILGLVLALALGGSGFFVMYSDMLGGRGGTENAAPRRGKTPDLSRDIAFVPIDPLIISLAPGGANRHLKLTAQLEVAAAKEYQVAQLMPRVLDVLNGYLRAVSVTDLEDPVAMIRLRAQMLRRVQVVTGEGNVRDLLITEFVLN